MATILMFDDVNVSLLPPGYTAYAAYGDGRYENASAVKARFPNAHILVIDVRGSYHNGDVLDIEKGDATNADAVAWFNARKGKTVATDKPVFYTSASNVSALVTLLAAHGITRSQYLIWSAHYGRGNHICSPSTCGYPQADGTQWTSSAMGKSLDESTVNEWFFKVPPRPTVNITKAIVALDHYDAALSRINNSKWVNRRVAKMRKTLASQRKYLVSKDHKYVL